MEDHGFILSLGVALTAAFVGGMIARRIGLPVIVGYVVSGIAISPSTPGVVADLETVQVLAELGVAFLLFSLGVEFSIRELLEMRRIAFGAGTLQVLTTIVLGVVIAVVLGWSWPAAVLFGMIVSLSSSVVAIKLLMLRGETGTVHGRSTAGIAIFQDLALVPLLVVLPILEGPEGNVALALLRSLGVAAAVLATVIFLGIRLVPAVLERVASTNSRELFLLAVIVIALGTAVATQQAGLSLALGAFLAGLVVSESDFSHQVLADIIPLREAFATLFFVSVGMLLDVGYVFDHLATILLIVVAIIAGKALILAGIVRAFSVAAPSALLVGILLAQIGELSFILASEGVNRDILGQDEYRLILAAAAGTLLVSPIFINTAPRLTRALERRLATPIDVGTFEIDDHHPRHTIVCGFGRLGAELADALQRRGLACVVVDSDAGSVRRARAAGFAAFYGDAGNPEVLRRVGVENARAVALAISDPLATEATVAFIHKTYPRIDVIARARSQEQLRRLHHLGADEVVQPEFEAGLELIRHVLQVHGVDQRQARAIIQRRRERYYERDPEPR